VGEEKASAGLAKESQIGEANRELFDDRGKCRGGLECEIGDCSKRHRSGVWQHVILLLIPR
jgi:hypothetical protein